MPVKVTGDIPPASDALLYSVNGVIKQDNNFKKSTWQNSATHHRMKLRSHSNQSCIDIRKSPRYSHMWHAYDSCDLHRHIHYYLQNTTINKQPSREWQTCEPKKFAHKVGVLLQTRLYDGCDVMI